jgi:crotonobetainyl-CoA:carnitine CoA-transferase CaiB-like acyl-CoA transferase
MRPALDGVLVADFSRVLAGPLATMILGDLGAEVVKVESPAGDDTRAWGPPWHDGQSTYSLAINRNKRSIVLDLDDADDRRRAQTLARRADVMVENFRPGALARFGLDYDAVRVSNPTVVYASITGFGTAPEAKPLGGYDFLVQAMSGLMSLTGAADGEPYKAGIPVADIVTGLYATIGILAALDARTRDGVGQHVHVSLMGSALAALGNHATAFLDAGVVGHRIGNAHPSVVPYQTFAASDGHFAVAVASQRLFERLCTLIGRPDLVGDERFVDNAARVAHRDALAVELGASFATRDTATWVSLLRAEGIPVGPINDVAGAFADARSLGLDVVVETPRPDGGDAVATVRNPVSLSATPPTVRRPPPRQGEHTAELRAWLDAD